MESEILNEINQLCGKYIKLRRIYNNCLHLIAQIKHHQLKEEERKQMTTLEIQIRRQMKEVNNMIQETLEKTCKLL